MITWNTDVSAPCCPGEILNDDDNRSILIQTDWDYPSVASSFGWSLRQLQKCPTCGKLHKDVLVRGGHECWDCDDCDENPDGYTIGINTCEHDGTDGTVDCPNCGLTAGDFISAAREWLEDHDGATADDPGYFDNGE